MFWAGDRRRNSKKRNSLSTVSFGGRGGTATRLRLACMGSPEPISHRFARLLGGSRIECTLCKPICRLLPWSSVVSIPQKSTTRRPQMCKLRLQALLLPTPTSDGHICVNHCADFIAIQLIIFSFMILFIMLFVVLHTHIVTLTSLIHL